MDAEGHTGSFRLRPGTPQPHHAGQIVGGFDLLIVGGGIYGAWTALEGALRGLRVAVVERGRWASGTSSKSSKLIHGGLRYLEHGDLGLVRKALHERRRLLRHAAHRVRPLRFVVPVLRGARLGPWRLRAGLGLYDLLAGERAGVPGAEEWPLTAASEGLPFLEQRRLEALFSYGDAATDDAALVGDVVAAAQAHGALCVAECPVAALERQGGRVVGAHLAQGPLVRARTTILCSGPWAFSLAGLEARHHARFTKGVHLELPALPVGHPFVADQTAVLLTAVQDGRVFFLIPWRGGTMVGTTDTDWDADPDAVEVTAEDESYLLTAVAHACPELGWTTRDITSSWAGLRTLGRGDGTASSLSREWQLLQPMQGLLIPVGGKLTSARVEAVRMIDEALR